MNSTKFKLNINDFWKGLLIAVGSAIFPVIMQSINANQLIFDWKLIATTGIGAFLTYIAKNYFTDDTKQAVKTLDKQGVSMFDTQTNEPITPATVAKKS